MKKMTVSEFGKFCKKECPKHIIFDDENQGLFTLPNTLRISAVFNNIHVWNNPNTIRIFSDDNSVYFDLVKYIYEGEETPIGRSFRIVCEVLGGDRPGEGVYTIVIR